MKSMLTKIRNAPYALMAAVTIAAMSGADDAQAATASNIGGVASGLMDQVANVGKVTIAGAFLGGIYMLAGGLIKLKQASESQGQQTPYSAGMWRLALGGGLVALPAMASVLTNTAGLDNVQMGASTIF
jgi:hypothetical protein